MTCGVVITLSPSSLNPLNHQDIHFDFPAVIVCSRRSVTEVNGADLRVYFTHFTQQ